MNFYSTAAAFCPIPIPKFRKSIQSMLRRTDSGSGSSALSRRMLQARLQRHKPSTSLSLSDDGQNQEEEDLIIIENNEALEPNVKMEPIEEDLRIPIATRAAIKRELNSQSSSESSSSSLHEKTALCSVSAEEIIQLEPSSHKKTTECCSVSAEENPCSEFAEPLSKRIKSDEEIPAISPVSSLISSKDPRTEKLQELWQICEQEERMKSELTAIVGKMSDLKQQWEECVLRGDQLRSAIENLKSHRVKLLESEGSRAPGAIGSKAKEISEISNRLASIPAIPTVLAAKVPVNPPAKIPANPTVPTANNPVILTAKIPVNPAAVIQANPTAKPLAVPTKSLPVFGSNGEKSENPTFVVKKNATRRWHCPHCNYFSHSKYDVKQHCIVQHPGLVIDVRDSNHSVDQ